MKAFPILALGTLLQASVFALDIRRSDEAIVIRGQDRELLRYVIRKPADSKLPLESASYFHPFTTPSGVVMTDVAPSDHLHHRGIFLGWVEMHGKKDADFWGWGAHAPVTNRVMTATDIGPVRSTTDRAMFSMKNAWKADGETMLTEQLQAAVLTNETGNILDLEYTLTPSQDIKLSQWAFSGFCVRTRKDGELTAFSPKGKVDLSNPVHTKPASDWPDERWYAYRLNLPNGKVAGIAVMNHPENPPTLWHNHRDVRMLNPCIVAPSVVELKENKPLVLRYRVIAFDGDVPAKQLDQIAGSWTKIR